MVHRVFRKHFERDGMKLPQRDVPDYKPYTLRLSFLAILFLLICGLLSSLEYLIRTLPWEQHRREMPDDFPYLPRHTGNRHQNRPHSVLKALSIVASTTGLRISATPEPHTADLVARTAPNIKIVNFPTPEPEPEARPPSTAFANNLPAPTYLTWANSWYDTADRIGLTGSFVPTGTFRGRGYHNSRTPLFPGDDAPGECIYRYQGILKTTNSSACEAIIDGGGGEPPAGWKRATWLRDEIWVRIGGGCDENYDDWYAGWPSNNSPPIPLPESEPGGPPPYYQTMFLALRDCTWSGTPTGPPTRRPEQTGMLTNPWFPAYFRGQYFAINFPREPDGRIIWPVLNFSDGKAQDERNSAKLTVLRANLDRGTFDIESVYLEATVREAVPSVSATPTSEQEMSSPTTGQEMSTPTTSGNNIEETEQPVTETSTPTSSVLWSDSQTTDSVLVTSSTISTAAQTSRLQSASSFTNSQLRPTGTDISSSTTRVLETEVQTTTSTHSGHSPEEPVDDNWRPETSDRSTPGIIFPNTDDSLPKFGNTLVWIPEMPGQKISTWTDIFTSPSTTKTRTYVVTPTSNLLIVPIIMAPATTRVITNPQGVPITTISDYGGKLAEGTAVETTTITGSGGTAITTVTLQVPTGPSVVRTYSDPSNAVPTATKTFFPVIPNIPYATLADDILVPSSAMYFTIYFLPIFLTVLLLVPVQAIDAEIKVFMPFRLLTRPGGSADALPMRTGGLVGRWNGIRILLLKHLDPISVLGDLLLLCTVALVSFSGEAVGTKLRGACVTQNLNTCFISIAIFPGPARVVQGLLGAQMVILVALGITLHRWKSGVAAHPTSVATICSLMQVPGVRGLIQWVQLGVTNDTTGRSGSGGDIVDRFRAIRFSLGRAETGRRGGRTTTDYGLLGVRLNGTDRTSTSQTPGRAMARASPMTLVDRRPTAPEKLKLHVPVKQRVEQFLFLFFLCGLLTMILYYEFTVYEDPNATPFEAFMDSQGFGVRNLFTGLGVSTSFMWDTLFLDFANKNIYRLMAQRNQPASLSILLPRVTNVFEGLWRAISTTLRRVGPKRTLANHEATGASIAIAGILSKFLPILLSGVPFTATQTWQTHEICVWTASAILMVMILILLAHIIFVKWPIFLVPPAAGQLAPDSLACTVYYVCDSAMLRDFEGLSMLSARERDKRVERMGRMYRFGWMVGVSGERRIGIDYPVGEQGFKLRSLGPMGFGTTRGG